MDLVCGLRLGRQFGDLSPLIADYVPTMREAPAHGSV